MTPVIKRAGTIAAGVTVLVVAVWALLLYRPQSHHLATAHKAQAAAEQQLTGLQQQEASLQNIYAHIGADKAKYAVLETALPNDPHLPSAIDQINAASRATGLQITSISPTAPAATTSTQAKSSPGPRSITVSISGQGLYPQATAFVTDLTRSSRMFVVNSLQLSGGGNNGPLSVQIACTIFYAG